MRLHRLRGRRPGSSRPGSSGLWPGQGGLQGTRPSSSGYGPGQEGLQGSWPGSSGHRHGRSLSGLQPATAATAADEGVPLPPGSSSSSGTPAEAPGGGVGVEGGQAAGAAGAAGPHAHGADELAQGVGGQQESGAGKGAGLEASQEGRAAKAGSDRPQAKATGPQAKAGSEGPQAKATRPALDQAGVSGRQGSMEGAAAAPQAQAQEGGCTKGEGSGSSSGRWQ